MACSILIPIGKQHILTTGFAQNQNVPHFLNIRKMGDTIFVRVECGHFLSIVFFSAQLAYIFRSCLKEKDHARPKRPDMVPFICFIGDTSYYPKQTNQLQFASPILAALYLSPSLFINANHIYRSVIVFSLILVVCITLTYYSGDSLYIRTKTMLAKIL